MPIRKKPDGTLEFDSVAEAVEYESLLQERVVKQKTLTRADLFKPSAPPVAQATSRGLSVAFWAGLHEKQQAILTALSTADRMTTDEVAKAAGVEAASIGPMLRHLRARIEVLGLDADAAIIKEKIRRAGDRPATTFRLSNELKEVLDKISEKKA